MGALYTVAAALYRPTHAVMRQRELGVEHLPAGGFVLASNHLSNLDPFALAWALWPERPVCWMAKAELHNAALDKVMRSLNAFPIRRGEIDTGAFRAAQDLLRSGAVIGMFPEGTRRTKGMRKKFVPEAHPGTARIALGAGVPLVPAAIAGTDRLSRRGPVSVAYGPAIEVGDLASLPRRRAAEIATERLMAAIDGLYASLVSA
jgi:1-acyl-sn-glycerol-3-phosphate acyltransferase